MRGSQKSVRVSWASDVNLCQVRLFSSEESPSQVGLGAQDHLQVKASWASHPSEVGPDDNLPPGFEGIHPANLLKNKLSQIPLIKWRCPPTFMLNLEWQVVAGNESTEVEDQNIREMRVLEAVYPRPSAIPPDPSLLASVDDPCDNDNHTIVIPITPIEDEEAAAETSSDFAAPSIFPMIPPAQSVTPGIHMPYTSITSDQNASSGGTSSTGMIQKISPEILATAYDTLSVAMSKNSQGNLIDPDLLLKVLSDPKFVELLTTGHGAPTNSNIVPTSMSQGTIAKLTSQGTVAKSTSQGTSTCSLFPVHPHGTEILTASLDPSPSRFVYPSATRVEPVPKVPPSIPEANSRPCPPTGVLQTKDIDYYKRLIQKHGGERQETTAPSHYGGRLQSHHFGGSQESVNTMKPRDFRPKIMKPCIFFNTSKGCRNGPNCAYQHDSSSVQRISSISEVQNSKRMKLDREITGL